MALGDDYYRVLGLAKDASATDIKKAFRAAAKTCHPDVVGDDPEKIEQFKKIKEAYDVLSDPDQRVRYDRRGERRGPFVGYHWQHAGTPVDPTQAKRGPAGNDLDLEDIFTGFGTPGADFGFGGARRAGHKARAPSAPSPSPGRDIAVVVELAPEVAARGGTVEVRYWRLRRGDDGRSLFRYEELHELKVPPDARHGDSLRVQGLGDAGQSGGPYGDLVADLRIVAPPPGPRMRMPSQGEEPTGAVVPMDVRVVEAILGGRAEVETAAGRVRVTIPPGTSSGTRMRLKGRGEGGADVIAEVRIVVPRDLDAESRALIERFAELNPE
jgi:DnaJ-class molecular chaperone